MVSHHRNHGRFIGLQGSYIEVFAWVASIVGNMLIENNLVNQSVFELLNVSNVSTFR